MVVVVPPPPPPDRNEKTLLEVDVEGGGLETDTGSAGEGA